LRYRFIFFHRKYSFSNINPINHEGLLINHLYNYISFYSCFFDGVNGAVANVIICSVFLSLILCVNVTLYLLTWYRIRKEEFSFKRDENNEVLKSSHRAARSMFLFVAAFMIQWWAMAMYGIWQVTVKSVPLFLFQLGTIFSNIGGILNAVVYFLIRRQRNIDHARDEHYKPPNVLSPNFKTLHKPIEYELVKGCNES